MIKIIYLNKIVFILLISFTILFFLNACDGSAIENNTQESKEETEKGDREEFSQNDCLDNVYLQIKNQLFVLEKKKVNSFQFENKTFGVMPCVSSHENPVTVDEIVFTDIIAISKYNLDIRVQYQIGSKPPQSLYYLSDIKKSLSKRNLEVEDLPKEGSFYKYLTSEKFNSYKYIANHPLLKDELGQPIVFYGKHPGANYLDHDVTILWKNDLNVWIRTFNTQGQGTQSPITMEAWIDVYPILLNNLNSKINGVQK